MNIHEYQAKAVLREFGVPVPRGIPALSVDAVSYTHLDVYKRQLDHSAIRR